MEEDEKEQFTALFKEAKEVQKHLCLDSVEAALQFMIYDLLLDMKK